MKNKKEELITEISNLKQQFSNNQDVYINFYHVIGDAKRFIEHYENLLQKKKDTQNIKKSGYIGVLLIIIANICYISYTSVINPNHLANLFLPLVLGYSCISAGLTINKIIDTSNKIAKMDQELSENKTKYEEQKVAIPIYNKIQNDIGDYITQNVLPRIDEKKVELFQLNENNQEIIKPVIDALYPNPFHEEFYSQQVINNSKEDIKKLVRIKK